MKPKLLARAVAVLFLFIHLQAPQAAVLFQDNFDDGNANGWEETGYPWTVVEGAYDQELSGFDLLAMSTAGDEAWTNYALQVDAISLAGPQKDAMVRAQPDADSRYAATIRSEWGFNDVLLVKEIDSRELSIPPSRPSRSDRLAQGAAQKKGALSSMIIPPE